MSTIHVPDRATPWIPAAVAAGGILDLRHPPIEPHDLPSLENPGNIPLEVIEVQSGSYLGEDDIVRFEDKYGREGTNT